MTDWDDEQLGTLLEATFSAHEELADGALARRVAAASGVRRRRWPAVVAAAAAVALVVGGTTYLVGRSDRTSSSPTPLMDPIYRQHVQAARREAARVLRLAPVPDGARRLPGKPAGWGQEVAGPGYSNQGLARVRWFAVEQTPAEVRSFVLAHRPGGFFQLAGVGFGHDQPNYASYRLALSSPQTAYTAPELLVQWARLGDRTVLRVDVSIGALRERTAATVVDFRVTKIVARRYRSNAADHKKGSYLPAVLRLPDDRQEIDTLVRAFNELVPMPVPAPAGLCPMIDRSADRITFKGPDGVLTAYVRQGCPAGITATRDGRPVKQTLEPGAFSYAIDETIDHLY